MPDLPDYYTLSQISEAEAASFKGGLDANKSATPVSRDIYFATDTEILYICAVDGVWVEASALYLLLTGGTLTGDLLIGANKIKTTNLLLRELNATTLALLNTANDTYRDLYVGTLLAYGGVMFTTTLGYISPYNTDNYYVRLMARDNTVGLVEIARLQSAATAYLQATRGIVLKPMTDPANIVEGWLFYDSADDKLKYKAAAALRLLLTEALAATTYLALAGGTMAGNIAMGTNKVTGLGAPTAAGDAARKTETDLLTLLTTFNDHHARHENGGDDEPSVAALSGVLADDQHVIDAEAVSAMGAIGDANPLHHNKYTDAAAKAAAVQAGAITNAVTKAPTHDAVFDVKATADAAQPAATDDADAVAAAEAAGLALASGKNIGLISALTADHTWSGITGTFTVAQEALIGRLFYAGDDGKLALTDNNLLAKMPAIAIAVSSIAAEATGALLLQGFLRDDTWNWTPGVLLYTGALNGDIVTTIPAGSGDQVQVVGVAITADIIYFNPSLELVEVA